MILQGGAFFDAAATRWARRGLVAQCQMMDALCLYCFWFLRAHRTRRADEDLGADGFVHSCDLCGPALWGSMGYALMR